MKISKHFFVMLSMGLCMEFSGAQSRQTQDFDKGWKFFLGDATEAQAENFSDNGWRNLTLPHDWAIEEKFDEHSPATTAGGALTGGIGWYRKTFTVPVTSKNKKIFIDFDGVYMNSEVWINNHYLGKRPYGYSSFRYDLTPFLKFGYGKNVIAVKVNNAPQPNSRWYSGSGIYRNVWIVTVNDIFVDHWGTFLFASDINVSGQIASQRTALVHINVIIQNKKKSDQLVTIKTSIYNKEGKNVAGRSLINQQLKDSLNTVNDGILVIEPHLWSVEDPYLYKAVTQIFKDGKLIDEYTTTFGIRYFAFDVDKGFSLNGKHLKINGVCDHHDLGCLGTAINYRALQRQLEILKQMGCNAIRTSHNPPAPELLELCDKMGFIVLDEAFDMWKIEKSKYDYHLYWDEWHKKDLEDMVLRDRNHPCVIIWSIGNEINEGWDTKDTSQNNPSAILAKELSYIVHSLDTTRPITSALNNPNRNNPIYFSGALDLIGYNYDNNNLANFHQRFPGKKFLGTETVSALATRGHYDINVPSDSIRRWPERWDKPFDKGNADLSVSAYDQVSAPWGSTHEEAWKVFKKYDFLSGQFIWTGFDYIGEPTPYPWPARSSYFGIIDLAGFPKDIYYMYQSEWSAKTVLHILPHWNWKRGDTVDVWAYYNHADNVELFLNGKSLGTRKKTGEDLHVKWHVPFEPGTLKAVSKMNGDVVLTKEIKTAGMPAKIILIADRDRIIADGKDLSFVTVKIVDTQGNLVPDASNKVKFKLTGEGTIAGVDNGSETSMESFKGSERAAFNGLALAVVQSKQKSGNIQLIATSPGLQSAFLQILVK
jgi:beta-galactosidase